MPIRVILVDDHAIVREGVKHVLETHADIRVSATFGEAQAALDYAAAHRPDVAVIDVAMPVMNGIEVARRLRGASPATQVLVLSMHANPEYVHQALSAGASGYVLKESAGREVVLAVRAVMAGERYLSRRLANEATARYLAARGDDNPLERLSPREREVLQLTAEGRTSAEAAQLLGLSPKSVETYRSRVMTKLGLESAPALVKFAIRHGLTSAE
jgi:DNA-binding NarL/FixJ family response regulator